MTDKDNIKEGCTFTAYCNKWFMINRIRLKASSCAKYRADIENHIIPFFVKI